MLGPGGPPCLRNLVPVSSAEVLGLSFGAGLVVAVLTAPVGISGAVFLLPFQLTVLGVPNPAVTPTNLLFNIVAIPGALARYRTRKPLRTRLTGLLLAGTLPGVVIGAFIRVYLIPGPGGFRLFVAALLLPLGIWLLLSRHRTVMSTSRPVLPTSATVALSAVVGVIGGIYGVGGGSLLGPILVGRGMLVAEVAPATLVSTFVTSVVGAGTYVILAMTAVGGHISPAWTVGLTAGAGGVIGGYFGARLQPHLREDVLRAGLGVLAVATATLYIVQVELPLNVSVSTGTI